jgi:hypothetical protein
MTVDLYRPGHSDRSAAIRGYETLKKAGVGKEKAGPEELAPPARRECHKHREHHAREVNWDTLED